MASQVFQCIEIEIHAHPSTLLNGFKYGLPFYPGFGVVVDLRFHRKRHQCLQYFMAFWLRSQILHQWISPLALSYNIANIHPL